MPNCTTNGRVAHLPRCFLEKCEEPTASETTSPTMAPPSTRLQEPSLHTIENQLEVPSDVAAGNWHDVSFPDDRLTGVTRIIGLEGSASGVTVPPGRQDLMLCSARFQSGSWVAGAIAIAVVTAASERRHKPRPYNVIMKDVAAASGALRKSVEASDFATSAEQARRLEQLFKETEDFWTRSGPKMRSMPLRARGSLSASIGASASVKERIEDEDRRGRSRAVLHDVPRLASRADA